MDDSIVQLATAKVASAIHIIRFSGEHCFSFLERHISVSPTSANPVFSPRKLVYGSLVKISSEGSQSFQVIDQVMSVFLPGPHSYTGEDMVEIHCHGSLAIVEEILRVAISEDFRLARRGEFTYRGFINGKRSLEESEAIDTLIKSQSSYQRQNALNILEKKASLKFKEIEKEVVGILAELTSVIEFPEEDIPEIETDQKVRYQHYLNQCQSITHYFEKIQANYLKGKKVEEGIKVVLVGSPNAGKSTLMNLLLRDNRSIISPIKGTTRDYISERWNLEGNAVNPLQLIDTAGIHSEAESIESLGIEKSKELIATADIVIWLISIEEVESTGENTNWESLQDIKKSLCEQEKKNPKFCYLAYLNKCDLVSDVELDERVALFKEKIAIPLKRTISLAMDVSEESVALIETDIKELLSVFDFSDGDNLALLNERQATIAEKVTQQLKAIMTKLCHFETEEIILEDFNTITQLLKEMNMELEHQDVFDELFSRFCLGK